MRSPAVRATIERMQRHTAQVSSSAVRPRTGYPCLDAPSENPRAVLAFAHRGGAYHPDLEGLENTRAAFDHAVALGYDFLETDVHLTRDGVLLAFHDEALDRVTDRTGRVADLDLAEIRLARIGGREEIPTLESLLVDYASVRFNVDLKSAQAVAPLAEMIDRLGAVDRVCVGSFSHRRLRAFRRLTRDRVATSASPVETAAHRLLPRRLAQALVGRRFAAFQVPHRRGRFVVVTERFVRRAHALGAQVHVWTVDDPAEMEILLDRGVDGLITDRTDLLKDVLVARDQWRDAR